MSGTRSPVSTVSTVSSGSSRTASPAAEEVTMATLGMKIGDHILIDAKTSSSKAKVRKCFDGVIYCCCSQ